MNEAQSNVILILTDDMGFGDLSCFNEGRSRTPYLDKLVGESVWFSQAYSASAVCAPARAALLTGRYPHRTGVVSLNQKKFPDLTSLHPDEVTIADLFRTKGYVTGLVGKWHNGEGEICHPLNRGFDEFEGFISPDDYLPSYYDYKLNIAGEIHTFSNQYITDDLSDRAIEFVRRHKDQPFFLHLGHAAPHRPLEAPDEIVAHYRDRGFDENTALVYAMIEVMDQGIGMLMDELDALELRDNTIVIFASDNGPDPMAGERFNHQLKGMKYEVYEGGIHVPFMLSWPSKLESSVCDDVVHFMDVVPTLAEICDLDLTSTPEIDGKSFVDVLFDGECQPEDHFWQWNRGVPDYSHNAALRDGDWKLVRPFVTRNLITDVSPLPPALYNLKDDPSETIDLAEQYPKRVLKMNTKIDTWAADIEKDRVRHKNQ